MQHLDALRKVEELIQSLIGVFSSIKRETSIFKNVIAMILQHLCSKINLNAVMFMLKGGK